MTFELLVSTMHKTRAGIIAMLHNENIHCDCLVINQCDKEDYYEETTNRRLRIFFTTERGLSKSRNMAIKYASADIVGIADDDLYYYDGFDKIVIDFYGQNNKADVVLFNLDHFRKEFPAKEKKCKVWQLSSFMSVQCTFKLGKIKKNKIRFNELFGSGSGVFNSGEENIFLSDCHKKKLRIYFCGKKILRCDESESSWFTSLNDELFIRTRGAAYYTMGRFLYFPYILRFAVKHRKRLKPYSILQSLKLMERGKKEIIQLMKKDMVFTKFNISGGGVGLLLDFTGSEQLQEVA